MLPASSCKSSCKCYLVDSHLLLQHVPALGVFFFQAELSLVGFVLHLSFKRLSSSCSAWLSSRLTCALSCWCSASDGSTKTVGAADEDGLCVSLVLPSVAEPSSSLALAQPPPPAGSCLAQPPAVRRQPPPLSAPAGCLSHHHWSAPFGRLCQHHWSGHSARRKRCTESRSALLARASGAATRTGPNGCHAPTQTSGESPRTASPGAIARPRSRMLVQSSRGRRTSALRPWIETQSELRLSRSR